MPPCFLGKRYAHNTIHYQHTNRRTSTILSNTASTARLLSFALISNSSRNILARDSFVVWLLLSLPLMPPLPVGAAASPLKNNNCIGRHEPMTAGRALCNVIAATGRDKCRVHKEGIMISRGVLVLLIDRRRLWYWYDMIWADILSISSLGHAWSMAHVHGHRCMRMRTRERAASTSPLAWRYGRWRRMKSTTKNSLMVWPYHR